MTVRSIDSLLTGDDPALASADSLALAREMVVAASISAPAERYRDQILAFVDEHEDALHRRCRTGHLTGSAVVLDPSGTRVLLLHHRKLQRWLQPGGHCDGDGNLAAVALREATEESGLVGLRIHPVAIDLDVHEVDPPADGPHLHLDARYLVVAPDEVAPPGNHESTDIRWAPVTALDEYELDSGTHRMIGHALRLFRELSRP